MAAQPNKYKYNFCPAEVNFSDVCDDRTVYETSQASKSTFEPNEITGRSTSWLTADTKYHSQSNIDVDAVSVDDILGNSFVENIRHMSQNKQPNVDRSLSASIPRKYMSTSSLTCDKFSLGQSFAMHNSKLSESVQSDQFRPSEEMGDELLKDEKQWQNEFAAMPLVDEECDGNVPTSSNSNLSTTTRASGRMVNLTEFSGYMNDSTPVESSTTEMSIGRYFSRKCEDIRDMIPNSSPSKMGRPMPLFSNSHGSGYNTSSTATNSSRYTQASSSFYTDDELRIKTPRPKVNNATYDKNQSVMSISSIAARLNELDSPRAILSELVSQTTRKAAAANTNNADAVNRPQPLDKPFPKSGKPTEKPASPERSPETYKYRERGMLNRMDSTRVDEKENVWRQNASTADTIDNESMGDETDLSSFSFRPAPNSVYASQQNDSNSNARSIKRMRSPDQDALEADLGNLCLDSPTRDSMPTKMEVPPRQCNSGLDRPANCPDYRQVSGNGSTVDAMRYSLPNFGTTPNSYSTPNVAPLRSSSQCSTNSEFTQNDGKFPLKANTSELTWECVKLRKSVVKSFVVKNASEKKLSLKMEVFGPGFQIASSGADKESVTLQGHECRTIFIAFCPTVIGKAIGKVLFKPTRQWSEETERLIHLWAFGGNTALQLRDIERAPVGVSFLKMGDTSNIRSSQLKRSFTIYNKGPLNGIATIFLKQKNNQYANETHIQIEPSKCVIRPDSFAQITISYKLRRKDLEKLKTCEVLTVGTLEVITGAEPNRLRIASILKRNGSAPSYEQLEFLIKDFPAATVDKFEDFRENADKIPDLFGCFKTSEIALTINSTTLDETRENCTDLSIDDTLLFKTIIETPKDDEDAPSESSGNQLNGTWTVAPNRLSMDNGNNACKTITICSFFKTAQTFQIDSNNRSIFNFSKTSGYIRPGGQCTVDVELKANTNVTTYDSTVIAIYIERDYFEIPVTIRPAPIFNH